MLILISQCDYNVYDRELHVVADVYEGKLGEIQPYVYTRHRLAIPILSAQTAEDFRRTVEALLPSTSDSNRTIHDYKGLSWYTNS